MYVLCRFSLPSPSPPPARASPTTTPRARTSCAPTSSASARASASRRPRTTPRELARRPPTRATRTGFSREGRAPSRASLASRAEEEEGSAREEGWSAVACVSADRREAQRAVTCRRSRMKEGGGATCCAKARVRARVIGHGRERGGRRAVQTSGSAECGRVSSVADEGESSRARSRASAFRPREREEKGTGDGEEKGTGDGEEGVGGGVGRSAITCVARRPATARSAIERADRAASRKAPTRCAPF